MDFEEVHRGVCGQIVDFGGSPLQHRIVSSITMGERKKGNSPFHYCTANII
jgi:hypothetical protein